MADHFLTKTQIDLAQCLDYGGGLALESHAALSRAIADRVSPETATLFAEPLLNRGNDTARASVAWYSDIEGEGRRLDDLDDADRKRAEAILSEELRAIRAVLSDPEDGPLIGAALHVAGDRDIWVVNGRPVITNWGMLPAGMGRDAASRASHFATTLGKYLPLAAAPPLSARDAEARAAQAPSPVSDPAVAPVPDTTAPVAAAAPTTTGTRPTRDGRRLSVWAWLPLVILLALAGGTLAWLLAPGTRIFHQAEVDPGMSSVDAAAAIAETNAALVARRDALRTALAGAQCRADGTLLMPGGLTIEGLLPINLNDPTDGPGKVREASATPMLTPDPARVQVPQSGAVDTASLLDLIEARTVRVVARVPNGAASTGTGFFIAPDFVVTNFHVVSDPSMTEIFVINERIGKPLQAQIVSKSGPIGDTGKDFALLRVPDAGQPFYQLYRPATSLKLRSVIAAGFPGDMDFSSNDPQAVYKPPALTLTDGSVSNQQILRAAPGLDFHAIAHSAPISQGNSGGPLVDMCGRVIGVNTFARAGKLRTMNFALGTEDLLDFLSATPTAPDVVTQACSPELLRPSVQNVAAPNALPTFGLPNAGATE